MPPSKIEGEYPLVSQNRWFKYLPFRTNFIYPVIAAYGVTMIKNAGYDIDFIDCPAQEVSIMEVLKNIPKYDLLIMEGRTAIMNWLWELAKTFKEHNKDLKVALYGDHVMVRPEESLEKGIDYIIHCGDYDYGAFNLVTALDDEDNTPFWDGKTKRIFKSPLIKDLDTLPYLDRDVVPWKNYYETWRHKEDFGWVQSSRGCWAKCTFCSWVPTFYDYTIRNMRVTDAVNEIRHAKEKYGIGEFLDDSDTFLTKWGIDFAKELLERDLDVFWNMQTRCDQITLGTVEDWKLMKKSGLHIVKLGADGTNDYTLKRIQKGYDVETIKKSVEILKKAGLEVHINMILGYPWEDKKMAYDTIKFVKRLDPNQAQFSLIEPFIGTPIYEQALDNKWFNIDPDNYDDWDMKQPLLIGEMNSKEIAKLHRDAWRMFYLNPRFIVKQMIKSTRIMLEERNLESFKHLWRGFKGVYRGHMRAVGDGNAKENK